MRIQYPFTVRGIYRKLVKQKMYYLKCREELSMGTALSCHLMETKFVIHDFYIIYATSFLLLIFCLKEYGNLILKSFPMIQKVRRL